MGIVIVLPLHVAEIPFILGRISTEVIAVVRNGRFTETITEPSKEKTLQLMEELKKFTEVKNKDNLKRLIK